MQMSMLSLCVYYDLYASGQLGVHQRHFTNAWEKCHLENDPFSKCVSSPIFAPDEVMGKGKTGLVRQVILAKINPLLGNWWIVAFIVRLDNCHFSSYGSVNFSLPTGVGEPSVGQMTFGKLTLYSTRQRRLSFNLSPNRRRQISGTQPVWPEFFLIKVAQKCFQ